MPSKIKRPKSCATTKNCKKSTASKGSRTGHSFNASVKTEHTLIQTDKLDKVLDVNQLSRTVKVEAGMKLHKFNQVLWDLGYCLPSLGDIDQQSLAGLVSTATHGTGLKWGSISDSDGVVEMELITANGELLTLKSNDDLMKAARVSMGVLGVIYSLTFKVVPKRNLKMVTKKMSLKDALKKENYLNHDHFEFFYFPYTESAQAIYRDITSEPENGPGKAKKWFNEVFIENIMLDAILKVKSHRPNR